VNKVHYFVFVIIGILILQYFVITMISLVVTLFFALKRFGGYKPILYVQALAPT